MTAATADSATAVSASHAVSNVSGFAAGPWFLANGSQDLRSRAVVDCVLMAELATKTHSGVYRHGEVHTLTPLFMRWARHGNGPPAGPTPMCGVNVLV